MFLLLSRKFHLKKTENILNKLSKVLFNIYQLVNYTYHIKSTRTRCILIKVVDQ